MCSLPEGRVAIPRGSAGLLLRGRDGGWLEGVGNPFAECIFVDCWTPEQMHVLDVRPGITDPASIKFLNENELMEKAEDPEKYYIEVIMQEKIKLYLEYVEKHSFLGDLGLIFKTFWVIVKER